MRIAGRTTYMNDEERFAQAVGWISKQDQPDFDWELLTLWLEADPANREVYDEASLLFDTIERHRDELAIEFEPANDNRRHWWALAGSLGAIAAAGGAMFLIVPREQTPVLSRASIYETKRGEIRTVDLPGEVTVTLAPQSRLHADGNQMVIEGEAYFAVDHNPARKLVLTVGPLEVVDIGTRFTAQTGPGGPRVAVAQGSVTVRAGSVSRSLSAGQAAMVHGTKLAVTAVAINSVGDWNDRALDFTEAPLALVASQLNRYSDERVMIDPSVANRRFTGVVAIGRGKRPGESVAAIMGLDTSRNGANVRIGPSR
jgi:transmembrane sensor